MLPVERWWACANREAKCHEFITNPDVFNVKKKLTKGCSVRLATEAGEPERGVVAERLN